MRKVDAHVHCALKCTTILKNVLESLEYEKALVLPFEGQSLALIEETQKNNINMFSFAFSLPSSYKSVSEFEKTLINLRNTINLYKAIKIYKDVFFRGFQIGSSTVHLWDDNANEIFQIASENGLMLLVHCADPNDFWLQYPIIRKKQLLKNPHFSYFNDSTIIPKEKQIEYRNYLSAVHSYNKLCFAHLGGFPQRIDELKETLNQNFYIDTSVAIEEMLLLNDSKEVSSLLHSNVEKVLFGSDLIIAETSAGSEKIATIDAINYLSRTEKMFFETTSNRVPNCLELEWFVRGMPLTQEDLDYLFYKNSERLGLL